MIQLLFGVAVLAQDIVVLSPDGTACWPHGSTNTILWQILNASITTVSLRTLSTIASDTQNNIPIINSIPALTNPSPGPNMGFYTWTLPETQLFASDTSGSLQIIVSNDAVPSQNGQSAVFSVGTSDYCSFASTKGLLIGLVVGGIALLLIVCIIVYYYYYYRPRRRATEAARVTPSTAAPSLKKAKSSSGKKPKRTKSAKHQSELKMLGTNKDENGRTVTIAVHKSQAMENVGP